MALHVLGLAGALAILLAQARFSASTAHRLGVLVFAASLVLLYAASATYHALPVGRAKHWFMRLDYLAIDVFIAGCYSPFALGVLRRELGVWLFGTVWAIALLAGLLRLSGRLKSRLSSTLVYLGFGWLVVVIAGPLTRQVPLPGLALLLAGGLSYSVGAVFFMKDDELPFGHAVWHGFVVVGTVCHVLAITRYSA